MDDPGDATGPGDDRTARQPDPRAEEPSPATGPAPAEPPPAVVDHRLLNWRFVVPSLPDGLLLLPAAGEAADVPGAIKCDDGLAALGAGPYPASPTPPAGPPAAPGSSSVPSP